MAGIVAIAVVCSSANGDDAAVSGKGDAGSGVIVSGFSIDVSADLLPDVGCGVELINAYMAGIVAIAVVCMSTNGNCAAINGE